MILKYLYSFSSIFIIFISVIFDKIGGFCFISQINFSKSSSLEKTSISTPFSSFLTQPFISYFIAKLYINGRKPTPCTIPEINIFLLIYSPKDTLLVKLNYDFYLTLL